MSNNLQEGLNQASQQLGTFGVVTDNSLLEFEAKSLFKKTPDQLTEEELQKCYEMREKNLGADFRCMP